MLSTFIISLREFLEVFLIIGVFLGISKKLKLKREKEILLAATVGILTAIISPVVVFVLGAKAKFILNEENAELLEAYLMVFSGFFIAYVIFSLHKFFVLKRSQTIISAHQKLQKNIFDLSLFITIIFFIMREGFEIALFTATVSLFSQFTENIYGLLLGLSTAGLAGFLTFFAYTKFPIAKLFKITEYGIVVLGASLVKNGISELAIQYVHLNLAKLLPLNLSFIPDSSTFLGHFIKSFTGLEQNFSLGMLSIMFAYITTVYFLFLRKTKNNWQF